MELHYLEKGLQYMQNYDKNTTHFFIKELHVIKERRVLDFRQQKVIKKHPFQIVKWACCSTTSSKYAMIFDKFERNCRPLFFLKCICRYLQWVFCNQLVSRYKLSKLRENNSTEDYNYKKHIHVFTFMNIKTTS